MANQSTRRKFLVTGATVTGAALAGCTGGADDEPAADDGESTNETESTDGETADDGGMAAASPIETAYSVEQLRTNCGTIAHPNGEKFYLTAGAPSNRDPDGVGEWYVLDTESQLPIDPETGETVEEFSTEDVARDGAGYDTHGFWFVDTDDGRELFLLNRETDDGLVVDPATDEVIEEVDNYGPAPDIMWGSPDDQYLFVSLRGPAPLSGDPHAAEGETPGFSVFDTEAREVVNTVEPDPISDYSDEDIEAAQNGDSDAPLIPDHHGIGVVETADSYEIWALDQGTDIIYIYEPAEGDAEFNLVEEIDLAELDGTIEATKYTPHMVDFSSDQSYAAVACTSGGQTLVFDTANHELVEAIDSGASSHFAGFTPDDAQILVDAIGEGAIQQVLVDLDAETFELGETVTLLDEAPVADHEDNIESADPICHDHAGDFSYHTLGPGVDSSGLVVLNWAELGESAMDDESMDDETAGNETSGDEA